MKANLIVPACLLASATPLTAGDSPDCFIEVGKLVAPAGIGELGGAIRQLDAALRPQVEDIKRIKDELDAVQQRQQRAMTDDGGDIDLVKLDQERQQLAADLEEKHDRLKADYAAQQAAIVGPVQARVAQRAQAFGTERGCAELKMARAPELAALQSASARDVTGEFVAWYGAGDAQ